MRTIRINKELTILGLNNMFYGLTYVYKRYLEQCKNGKRNM